MKILQVILGVLFLSSTSVYAQSQTKETLATEEVPLDNSADAKPRNDPATWVTDDDYPQWAVQYDIDGIVRSHLTVDAQGVVQDCEVVRSSGSPTLDAITCEKLIERAEFVPAKDKSGDPTTGLWKSAVRWQIPEKLPPAPPESELQVVLTVEKDGTVSDCKVLQSEGLDDEDPQGRCAGNDASVKFAPITDAGGQPQRTRVLITSSVRYKPLPQ